VAAKTKAAKAPAKAAKTAAGAAKTSKPAAKAVAKPAAKVVKPPIKQPAAKVAVKAPGKPVAVQLPKAAAKPATKPQPKPTIVPKPSPVAVATEKAVSTVKSITKAIAGMVKATVPSAKSKPAPAPDAKTPTSTKKPETGHVKVTAPAAPTGKSKISAPAAASRTDAKSETGNTMKPSVTKGKATSPAASPSPSPSPKAAEPGARARGVKPNRPAAPQELLTAPSAVRVELPAGYKPKAGEEYMSPLQLEYFRQKLVNWRAELVEESKQTIDNLREEVRDVGDEAERATRETENSLELRTRDRYRKLISKIEKALKRVDDGSYGYCEETGEEIGVDRLEARPIATLCLDAQERWEHRQKLMGD
jgi:DnaK suppressor protein